MFNTQVICMDCKKGEKENPRYDEAVEADVQEIKKGNYNLKPLMITDIPFPVVGIQSVDLLKLEVGMPSVQTINLLRRRFNTNIFQDNDLWKQPHPIP